VLALDGELVGFLLVLSPCFSLCWLIRTKESVEENSPEKQQKHTIVFSEDVFFF
jgi:hypothetical protein